MYLQEKKTSCGITAEKGTLIFAILNIIVTGVASLLSIFTFIASIVTISLGIRSNEQQEFSNNMEYGAYMWAVSLFLMMASFIAFVFAVFLIHGITKKNAAHIKAYFVYGVVVTVVSLLPILAFTIIAISVNGSVNDTVAIGLGGFLAIFVYSLVLVMVRKTYKKFETINSQYDHQPLETQKC